MEKKIAGITASIVISSVILVAIIDSTDLSHYQSDSLRYNMNTECQVYAEFVNWDLVESTIDATKINVALTPTGRDFAKIIAKIM